MKELKKAIFYSTILAIFSCGRSDQENKIYEKNRNVEDSILLDSFTSLYKRGDTAASLNATQQFVIHHPNSDDGFNLLAIIYLGLNKDSLSKISVETALKLNAQNYGALTNFGILSERHGDVLKAEQYFKKAIEIEPKFVQPYSHLMAHYFRMHKYEPAKLYGEQAIALGNNIGDKAILCVIYHELGMKNKRDSMYQELVKGNYMHLMKVKDIINQ